MKKLMKAIRLYYERELSTMQGFNAEFAAEFPAQAGQLGMDGGQRDDPHIERFIQATALSNARIAKLTGAGMKQGEPAPHPVINLDALLNGRRSESCTQKAKSPRF